MNRIPSQCSLNEKVYCVECRDDSSKCADNCDESRDGMVNVK